MRSMDAASPRTARGRRTKDRLIAFVTLFASVGTLLCCALPSLLVLLGLGATVAAVLSAAPWLVVLSHHKPLVFAIAGTLIAAGFLYVYRLAPRLRGDALLVSSVLFQQSLFRNRRHGPASGYLLDRPPVGGHRSQPAADQTQQSGNTPQRYLFASRLVTPHY
jgi:hypothetical protein